MRGAKLTNASIARLTVPEGRRAILVHDAETPGLAVRVGSGGTKAWVYEYRNPESGRKRRKTLGRCSVLGIQEARRVAKEMAIRLTLGKSPKPAKAFTFEDGFKLYDATHVQFRSDALQKIANAVWGNHVPDNLKSRPLKSSKRPVPPL